MRRLDRLSPLPEFFVLCLVEAEDDLRALNEDRTPDQVRVLHHEIDRLLLRSRQRPLLEHRAARTHEVEEPGGVDVLLEELARRRLTVDVELADLEARFVQKTSGILTGGSRGLPVEGRFGHHSRIIEMAGLQNCRIAGREG